MQTLLFNMRIFIAACCVLAAVTFTANGAERQPQGFYVSTAGNDNNPGTITKPFLTPEKARNAIRELKKNGNLSDTFTVYFRKGDYVRTKTLDLNLEDSGEPNFPVVWKAYKGERVRFLGGRRISGFKPLNEEKILNRLGNQARKNVVVTNLTALGLHDFGKFSSRGFGRPTIPAHGELIFNNLPMTLARWPNTGEWERIKDFPRDSIKADGLGEKMGSLPSGFYYSSDRPAKWKNTGNIWVYGYWAYDWANSYERITELNPGLHFVKTAEPYGNYGFVKNQRFCFLNILEELDQPGEWFLDRESGKLYFWPPSAIESGEAIFSELEEPFLQLNGVSHVFFSEIEFEASRGNAIQIEGGDGNRIAGCILRNIGNNAILVKGGKNHGIVSCDISDCGDCGVDLTGGDRKTLTACGHFVENCHFQRQGRWTKCYVPAVSMTGVGMRVSHCLIHDHPHAAIVYIGNEITIEYNDIHHTALETGDVGAIYTGRNYTYRGNSIRYNYIHETGGVRGSKGIYMDDCTSGSEVYGNIFYKVHWGMFIGGGRDHHVENNLFVDCHLAVRADGRGVDPKPMWQNLVNNMMRESLQEVPADLYRERYPAIKTLDKYYGKPGEEPITGKNFKGIPPEGNIIATNVCFGPWKEITEFADEKIFDIRNNYVTDDLSKVGAPETGFLIPSGSPAWTTGFKPIPFSEIGLYRDSYRKLNNK
jgi:hypothetical protein